MNHTEIIARARWELTRFVRLSFVKFGLFGWILLVCTLIILFLFIQKSHVLHTVHDLQKKQDETQQNSSVNLIEAGSEDGRVQLKAFQDILLPYDNIPNAVQDMIQLAEEQDLSIAHGDYKPQLDIQGGYLRYQMVLPVTGNIRSIHKYIQNVLVAQKTLALESIKFKREQVDDGEIEARIQWVLFTRLPANNNTNYDNVRE